MTDIQVGDKIATVDVTGLGLTVEHVSRGGAYIAARRDGNSIALPASAVTVKPRKVNVGDVITGRRVRDIRWKRGTVLEYVGEDATDVDVDVYMLNGNGTWHANQHPRPISFDRFTGTAMFKVIHAPGKP